MAAALLRGVHEVKIGRQPTLKIWGSSTPRREFLHVDDCANALVLLMKAYSEEAPINVGAGKDITILELLEVTEEVFGYKTAVVQDLTKPDAVHSKLLDFHKFIVLDGRRLLNSEQVYRTLIKRI